MQKVFQEGRIQASSGNKKPTYPKKDPYLLQSDLPERDNFREGRQLRAGASAYKPNNLQLQHGYCAALVARPRLLASCVFFGNEHFQQPLGLRKRCAISVRHSFSN